jgi:hypothetical protein
VCGGKLKASIVVEIDTNKHIIEILEDDIATFSKEN